LLKISTTLCLLEVTLSNSLIESVPTDQSEPPSTRIEPPQGLAPAAAICNGFAQSRQLDGLNVGLGTDAQCLHKRDKVTARGDVVIMHGKADVIDAAFFQGLVVGG
jgi:hypothetical protein